MKMLMVGEQIYLCSCLIIIPESVMRLKSVQYKQTVSRVVSGTK
jgi:hypothetical protein